MQRFGWGRSNPKNCTLSFWAKTSVAGTYCVSFRQGAATKSQIKEYTLSANTWTKVELTITGDADSTWLNSDFTTNGKGILIEWNLGKSNSKNTSTVNSWISGNKVASNNQVRWIATLGATFSLTGFQLEVGQQATPFEHRSIGDELARCQRYCVVIGADQEMHLGTAHAYNSTNINLSMHVPVAMRVKPTASVVLATSGGDANKWLQAYMGATGVKSNASISVSDCSEGHAQMRLYLQNAHSGLSVGQALWCHTLPDAKLILDAEL